MSRPIFRLVEDPLGPDALERPDRAELMALWDRAKAQPVPDYEANTLGPFLARRYAAGRRGH